MLLRDHANRPDLAGVCQLLGTGADPECDRVLSAILARHPVEQVRGIAALALARSLSLQAALCQSTDPSRADTLIRQAEEKLRLVQARYAAVRLGSSTLGAIARQGLQDVRHLNVGTRAQEIEGLDLDGNPLKLSDHRGKVVVLDFWANWCGYCRVEYAPTRALIERLKGRPFAYLGINCDDDKAVVQRVVRRQKLNWPSWYDGGSEGGRIQQRWQIYGFPTLFVIDHKGIIRHKNLRGAKLQAAVEQLLREQERDLIRGPGAVRRPAKGNRP
jgi:thiol-disulfide isomerase/thioredoxin